MIVLFGGPTGAGKSTLARAWCATRPRATHIELDEVRHLIVSGLADPQQAGDVQEDQYRLSVAATCALARTFADSGYDVAIDDVSEPGAFSGYWRPQLNGLSWKLVIVLPSLDETVARSAQRHKRVMEKHTRTQHARCAQWRAEVRIDTTGLSRAEPRSRSRAAGRATDKVKTILSAGQCVDPVDPRNQQRMAVAERLMINKYAVKELVVSWRHAERRIFDERKRNAIGGGESAVEQKIPSAQESFQQIERTYKSRLEAGDHSSIGVGRVIDEFDLDRTRRRLPRALEPLDKKPDLRTERVGWIQPRVRKAALNVFEDHRGINHHSSVIVLKHWHAALAAQLDHR